MSLRDAYENSRYERPPICLALTILLIWLSIGTACAVQNINYYLFLPMPPPVPTLPAPPVEVIPM